MNQVTTPDGISQQYHEMHFDDAISVSSTGSKRGREEDEEEAAAWTEADVIAMQNVGLGQPHHHQPFADIPGPCSPFPPTLNSIPTRRTTAIQCSR
jgi:hypothetical protein